MCLFCDFDKEKLENTIIEETDNFFILPALGALVDGYLLIVSKEHINSMANLDFNCASEYIDIIEKYRNKFFKIYGRYPIIFEHGTPKVHSKMKANSVNHAHTHIVNHNYYDEDSLIEKLNLNRINCITDISDSKNYISYISPSGINMVSYSFIPESQLMRKMISKDLGIYDMYNWKDYSFTRNIKLTIEKFK